MNKLAIILAVVLLASSCNKLRKKTCPPNQQCDQSEVCLINYTQDTIYYSWGSNIWDSILLPGESDCMIKGRVDVSYDKKKCEEKYTSWSTWTVHSSVGEWAVNLDHCHKKSVFRYDPDYTGTYLIQLYDESD